MKMSLKKPRNGNDDFAVAPVSPDNLCVVTTKSCRIGTELINAISECEVLGISGRCVPASSHYPDHCPHIAVYGTDEMSCIHHNGQCHLLQRIKPDEKSGTF